MLAKGTDPLASKVRDHLDIRVKGTDDWQGKRDKLNYQGNGPTGCYDQLIISAKGPAKRIK